MIPRHPMLVVQLKFLLLKHSYSEAAKDPVKDRFTQKFRVDRLSRPNRMTQANEIQIIGKWPIINIIWRLSDSSRSLISSQLLSNINETFKIILITSKIVCPRNFSSSILPTFLTFPSLITHLKQLNSLFSYFTPPDLSL